MQRPLTCVEICAGAGGQDWRSGLAVRRWGHWLDFTMQREVYDAFAGKRRKGCFYGKGQKNKLCDLKL